MSCYAAKGVVTPKEMRALEQKAIGAGYPALLLMEHAAEAVVNALEDTLGGDCRGKKVLFLCGKGNNGGDGLAAARLFLQRGGIAEVWLSDEPATEDARVNLNMLRLVTDRIYVLRDMPNVLNVFVKADMQHRVERAVEHYGFDPQKAEDAIKKADKQRASYYNYYSTNIWGDVNNYDLCVDTGTLGVDGAVELIADCCRIREKQLENGSL